MDSYERLMRALNFEEPDRVPIWDTTNNLKIVREVGGEGPPEEVCPKACYRLGLDVGWGIFDLSGIDRSVERIWETFEWNNLVFEQPLTLREYRCRNAVYFVPNVIKRPFKTLEDIRNMKVELAKSEDELVEEIYSSYCEEKKHYEKYGIPAPAGGEGVIEQLPLLFGWPLLARAIHHGRDVLGKIMDLLLVGSRARVKAAVEAEAPVFVLCDDIAEKHGLLYPIDFLREMWLPRIKKIIQPALKAGIPLIYHSEGNTEAILNDIIEVGFRGHHPIEPGSMDIKRLKEKFGDRLALLGGIDNWDLLQNGSPKDVEYAVKETIRKV
ncbi:MAG: uroporphyrinogen decarboxylase family protein, partial [Candidatus Freyarchaeota archaeon]